MRSGRIFAEHIKPVLDEQKKLGLISDYKVFINPTLNKADDWDVAVGVLYTELGGDRSARS